MRELSLHVLDIIQNSIAAGSDLIELKIKENIDENKLIIEIKDNGRGIKKEDKNKVTDPFVTSRNTREVGLGLSLLKAAAERCQGRLDIESEEERGTEIRAIFDYNHIDRAPLGDIAGTITSLLASNPNLNIIYRHSVNQNRFELNTKEIKKEIKDIKINNIKV
ncbi:MAG: ATP-binding protein, partial [Bacillota bacterium]